MRRHVAWKCKTWVREDLTNIKMFWTWTQHEKNGWRNFKDERGQCKVVSRGKVNEVRRVNLNGRRY